MDISLPITKWHGRCFCPSFPHDPSCCISMCPNPLETNGHANTTLTRDQLECPASKRLLSTLCRASQSSLTFTKIKQCRCEVGSCIINALSHHYVDGVNDYFSTCCFCTAPGWRVICSFAAFACVSMTVRSHHRRRERQDSPWPPCQQRCRKIRGRSAALTYIVLLVLYLKGPQSKQACWSCAQLTSRNILNVKVRNWSMERTLL